MKQLFFEDTFPSHSFVATIGFFDGVHLGHRFLLDALRTEAALRKLPSLVISFDKHPKEVLSPQHPFPLLTTNEEKETLLSEKGIDACVLLPFDKEMASLSAKDFLASIVVEKLGVDTLLIGYDHRFGHDRCEGFDDYVRYGTELGLRILSEPSFVGKEGEHVSSSVVRHLLSDGAVEAAANLLARPYSFSGTVIDGHKIGRTIGFPTANIRLKDSRKIIPANGVYAVKVTVGDFDYSAMMNIGHRPTLNNGDECSMEVYLLDFSGDLYGKTISIAFYKRIREEIRFESLAALTVRLEEDRQLVKHFFSAKK